MDRTLTLQLNAYLEQRQEKLQRELHSLQLNGLARSDVWESTHARLMAVLELREAVLVVAAVASAPSG